VYPGVHLDRLTLDALDGLECRQVALVRICNRGSPWPRSP